MNLDSLMDTLTNVVGFMIMLMVMMMLGVGDAVKRIKETNPELGGVSAQELAQIKAQAADVAAVLAKLQEQAQPLSLSAADAAAQLAREKAALAELHKQVQNLPPAPAPTKSPDSKLDEQIKKMTELEKQVLAQQQELAKLQALLAQTPEPARIATKNVKLPDPREAPKGAKPVYFFCRGGQIYPVDFVSLKEVALNTLKRVPNGSNKDGTVNCDVVAQAFNTKTLGDRQTIIRLEAKPDALLIYFQPRPGIAEDLQAIERPTSSFQRIARKAAQDGQYARFHVWSDSYEIYLQARKFTDSINLPAGWDPFNIDQEWKPRLYEIKCFGAPAPPTPPKPPAPGTPPPVKPPPTPQDNID
jgi:hypothetical protein